MSTASERNQFRRLIGDFGINAVDDATIEIFLNDAVRELTADFATPVTVFDTLVQQFHPEVIYWAAINWWWDYASKQTEKEMVSMGDATSNPSTRWDRAMQMIDRLTKTYMEIQLLGIDVYIGNLSRFSKATLTRIGGHREEDYFNAG